MNDLTIIEHKGMRVLTTQQLSDSYETDTRRIAENFNRNKEHYVEGKHYICLKGDDLRAFRANTQIEVLPNINTLYLWTEKGALLHAKSLNTDKAWEVYDRLVETYFRVRWLSTELSPQMQMLYGMLDQMAQTERKAKEAKEIAQKAVETTENIKEAVQPILDNWRDTINSKFNRIQKNTDKPFNMLRSEMYGVLEMRAGCDLNTRLRNKKQRMSENGCTKTEINNFNKMDVIEEDKRLKEIFSKIVSEYEIKYCA